MPHGKWQMTTAPFFHPLCSPLTQDWSALRSHLYRAGFELDVSEQPIRFATGLSNLNYLIKLNEKCWVLRRPPAGDLPPGANDMAREYQILSTLYQAYPLAPRAIHFSDDKSILGAPFLIMEYRPGLVISGQFPNARTTTPTERSILGLQLVDLLANLHSVDVSSVGLTSLGRPEGMLERMIEGWSRRAELAFTSTDRKPTAGIARVHAWLLARRVPARKPCLLHSDFKLDNVILDPETLVPRAVIDWDMGTRGDPLVDLATLLSYWTQQGDPEPMLALNQMPTTELGFPSRNEVLQAYVARTGIDLSDFHFYRVLAMFKLTVVFMQLNARFLRGEVTQGNYATFGVLAEGLLECTEAICNGELN